MDGQEEGAAAPVSLDGEAPVEVSAATTGTDVPSTDQKQFDPDAYFSTLSDEQRSEVAQKHFDREINRRIEQGINKSRQKLEAEYNQKLAQAEQERTQRSQIQEWVDKVKALPADRRGEFLSDPQVAAQYAQATAYLAQAPSGGVDARAYMDKVYADFKKSLSADDGFADIDLDGIEPGESLGQYLGNVTQARLAKERRALQEEMKKQVEATVKEALAKLHAQSEEPSSLPPSGASSGGLTPESYAAMSREERAKLSEADIDRMARRAQGLE